MLLAFVIVYWLISVGIGLWAARLVHGTKDYVIAGRALPLYVVTATIFATWFGSETVLGIPATFVREGIGGILADPFGSSLCLILVGLFFARPLYRMNLLTIGDYYRVQYGRSVETITTVRIVISYLGWAAAQITALGLVFNTISGGALPMSWGMVIGASTVMFYTLWGGMWAVAITDLLQIVILMLGMLYVGWNIGAHAGGIPAVINHAIDAGKFANFFPDHVSAAALLAFVAALITMMLGSIPQQDIFQRVASSNNERTAGRASVLGGVLYFCFAFIPMFLAYSATLIDPTATSELLADGKASQHILPNLILGHTPVLVQVIFFGALLSAIKSCASATLLAPSVTFTENILKPALGRMSDRQLLGAMRIVVLGFTCLVTLFALHSNLPIYNIVENAYKVTLVGAFVPLAFGIYWKRANTKVRRYRSCWDLRLGFCLRSSALMRLRR